MTGVADLRMSRREGSAATKMEEVQARGRLPLRLACSPLTRLSHLRITSPPPGPQESGDFSYYGNSTLPEEWG